MKHEELKGKWNQLKGKVREQWGELTGDDLDKIDGRHDQLVGRIQERYGKTREAAEREVEEWSKIN